MPSMSKLPSQMLMPGQPLPNLEADTYTDILELLCEYLLFMSLAVTTLLVSEKRSNSGQFCIS